jgi:cytochrome c
MNARRVGAAIAGLLGVAAAPNAGAADAAQLARGQQVYERCVACHSIDANRTGPQHCGLFGRRAGTAPGYEGYSKALRYSKIVWDARTLDEFLRDPMRAVPGTAMGYAGIPDSRERADLIAWLREATRLGQSCRPSR